MEKPNTHQRKYLETQIKTASKEKLLLMLYDGAIGFAEQARKLIEDESTNNSEEINTNLIKSQRIIAELISSLDFDKNRDVATNLARLYGFIYQKFIEANLHKKSLDVAEGITILKSLRETWKEAISGAESSSAVQAKPVPASAPASHTPISLQA